MSDKYSLYLNEVVYFHRLLTNQHIDHVFIKVYRETELFHDSNIDVLVRQSHRVTLEKTLKILGFKPTYSYKEPEKTMYIHPRLTSLHVHYHITWNRIPYLGDEDVEYICSNPQIMNTPSGSFPIPTTDYRFLIHCAHMVFENYSFTPGELTHLRYLAQQSDHDENRIRQTAARNGWEQALRLVTQRLSSPLPRDKETIPLNQLLPCFIEKASFEYRHRPSLKQRITPIVIFPSIWIIVKSKELIIRAITGTRFWKN